MFERLAAAWKSGVAVVSSQYTHGTAIVAAGGAVDYIPMLNKYGGLAIAAIGVYVLSRAIVASVKK